jgi:serine/threonine protein kinase
MNARLSDLLERLLDAPPNAREDIIANECRGDPGAADTLRRMLDSDARAEAIGFLESPLPLLDDKKWQGTDVESDQRGFGAYTLLRLIGRGGMGEVYLAERHDGEFQQRVALKLLPEPTPGLMRKFRRERQILAGLEHPNIARLIDGGIGTRNVPYFAMEYVEGTPINAHCLERGLDVRAILRLFLRVCDAVQYAHRNLVVHRDLKPSNILVTHDGAPKLLDFGIAKLLQTSGAEDATQTAARAFTPDYAAPEQIHGEPVTTATDVYSLGVVLYELLCGVRPYRIARGAETPERAIDHTDPPPPSAAAARTIGTTSARQRQLRGDLDRIVLTALAKELPRRYASVEALARDIERYLDGFPIAARGDSAAYRVRKFIRRNKFVVIAACLFVLSLCVGLVGTLWQARRAGEEAARAQAEKDFLQSVFAVADPDVNKGKSVTADQLLERGAARIDSEFSAQPELRAELQDTIGKLYLAMGDYAQARTLLERGLSEESVAHGKDSAEYAGNLLDLARANTKLDRYAAADPQVREALALLRRRYGDEAPQLATALRLQGEIDTELSRVREAEAPLQQALAIDKRTGSELDVADDTAALAGFEMAVDHYQQGRDLYAQALERYRELLGKDNSRVLQTQSDLANSYFYLGDIGKSIELSQKTAETARAIYGPDHPFFLHLERDLAGILVTSGRYDQAEAIVNDILPRTYAVLGPRHSDVAQTLLLAGIVDYNRDRLEQGIAATREAIDIWRESLGPENERLVAALKILGVFEGRANRVDDAIRAYEDALDLSGKLSGKDTTVYADLEGTLGKVNVQKGELAAADRWCKSAAERTMRLVGPAAPLMAETQYCLASVATKSGDNARGLELWKQALATARLAYADAPSEQRRFLYAYTKQLTTAGNQQQALAAAEENLAMCQKLQGPDAQDTAAARVLRGIILARLGRHDEAVAELHESLEACRRHVGPSLIGCRPRMPDFYKDCTSLMGTDACGTQPANPLAER